MTHIQTLQAMLDKVNERITRHEQFYNQTQKTLGRDATSDATSRWYMSHALTTIANATQERDALAAAIDLMTKFEEAQRKWASARVLNEADDIAFTWVEVPKDV